MTEITFKAQLNEYSITRTIGIRVVDLTMSKKKATLYLGGTTKKKPGTIQLNVIGHPKTISAKSTAVTWLSENEDVAQVDADGLVIAVGKGKTKIRAFNAYGLSCECTLVVKAAGKQAK